MPALAEVAATSEQPGAAVPIAPGTAESLKFGVYSTDSPSQVFAKFTPFIDATEAAMSTHLGRSVAIELRVFQSYEAGHAALVASYILAKQQQPAISLLAMESKQGKKRFPGLIIVRDESPLRTLADLRGARFAFGNANSTFGRYLTQAELIRAGIYGRDLAYYEYLGRHDKVAAAVALGDFDAGAVKASTFTKANRNGGLRVLYELESVTKPWVARAGLDPALTRSLRAVLIDLRDEAAFRALGATTLLPADDSEYQPIRADMAIAAGFDADE